MFLNINTGFSFRKLLINSLVFLGLLGIVRGVTAMCGPPLGGLIFEKFEVSINY